MRNRSWCNPVSATSRSIATLLALILSAACGGGTEPDPALAVESVSPNHGPQAGGTSVTIVGTRFVDVTTVTIAGEDLAQMTIVSETEITGITPAIAATGPVDVIVMSSSEGTTTCTGCFTSDVTWASLAANSAQACGITIRGKAYCWGRNDFGQLGTGSTVDSPTPIALSGDYAYTSLTTGSRHSCGLTSDNVAYCWGMNDAGQVGDGTTTNRLLPVAVAGGHRFTKLIAGSYSTCGLTAGGAAYCWGFNDSGQLGDASTTNRTQPVAVAGGLTFTDLAAAHFHTCGRTTTGAGYCWGRNDVGQLGDGSTTQRESPAAVAGGLSFLAAPQPGFVHTCAVAVGGTAYCWGYNYWGQLGDAYASEVAGRTTPGPVVGTLVFTQLAVGAIHSCGVTAAGGVSCWGYNGLGQLGNNSTQLSHATPASVVTGGVTFISVVAGEDFTCGLANVGTGYCWGRNLEGQLGDGTLESRPLPGGTVANP